MIDLHCHILPGIDDGPSEISDSLEMCRMAADDGIGILAATPHFNPGLYEPSSETVLSLINELNTLVNDEGIDIKIIPGADVSVTPELETHLKTIEHLSINRGKKYFLAELPHSSAPDGWDKYLNSFINKGFTPILTHPERNTWLNRHPKSLYAYTKGGGLIQITAMSITGEFGEDAQKLSFKLLEDDMVHVIASDGHSPKRRPPLISKSVKWASNIVGSEKAIELVTTIPSAIVEGREFTSLHTT